MMDCPRTQNGPKPDFPSPWEVPQAPLGFRLSQAPPEVVPRSDSVPARRCPAAERLPRRREAVHRARSLQGRAVRDPVAGFPEETRRERKRDCPSAAGGLVPAEVTSATQAGLVPGGWEGGGKVWDAVPRDGTPPESLTAGDGHCRDRCRRSSQPRRLSSAAGGDGDGVWRKRAGLRGHGVDDDVDRESPSDKCLLATGPRFRRSAAP